MTTKDDRPASVTALRNIALGLEPDAAREVMEAATELEQVTGRCREAEARYTVLLLDLLADADISTSRAARLTGVSESEIRRWSLETFRSGQQTTFPFPAKVQS